MFEKKYIPNLHSKIFEKHPEVRKKNRFQKQNLSTHMRFSTFDKCNLYQNQAKNLAFATRASQNSKKYFKNLNFTF